MIVSVETDLELRQAASDLARCVLGHPGTTKAGKRVETPQGAFLLEIEKLPGEFEEPKQLDVWGE